MGLSTQDAAKEARKMTNFFRAFTRLSEVLDEAVRAEGRIRTLGGEIDRAKVELIDLQGEVVDKRRDLATEQVSFDAAIGKMASEMVALKSDHEMKVAKAKDEFVTYVDGLKADRESTREQHMSVMDNLVVQKKTLQKEIQGLETALDALQKRAEKARG